MMFVSPEPTSKLFNPSTWGGGSGCLNMFWGVLEAISGSAGAKVVLKIPWHTEAGACKNKLQPSPAFRRIINLCIGISTVHVGDVCILVDTFVLFGLMRALCA